MAIIALLLFVVAAAAFAASLLVERHRVAASADAAALVAADTAAGRRSGDPCAEAAVVAEANRVRLVGCRASGSSVTVRAASIGSPVPVGATATAGRPPS
ncbi:Rv3654c family TadE-like protein [Frondihabitans sp. PAMC 28766]|uniref:Rv3654c family TadE-like protein n=1 Tax=Frondihabitans sp. PAMC 28766 TaxID=1795630 RepID=UPI0012FF6F7C|nr:Rv3654c family TadE-like protein [Frondihabitans sp. PAMC 28766]